MLAFALLSVVVALLGWTSIVFVMKVPGLRKTMWPVWMFQIFSLGLAAAAFLSPGESVLSVGGILAVGTVGSFALFLFAFALFMRVPSAPGRPEIGKPFPNLMVTNDKGEKVPMRDLLGSGPAMIVFFRGFWCLACTDELKGLSNIREVLRKRGGDILAISADKFPVFEAGRKRLPNLPCLFACDPGGEEIGPLNLLQENMLKFKKRVAVPSNILIDAEGIVRWTHYASIVMDRPDPLTVLRQVQNLP